MEIKGLNSWGEGFDRPMIIAGPCSAETEDQLYATAKALSKSGVKIIRAGVWKPRTRPNNFEGMGLDALKWIRDIKQELNVKFAVEVGNPQHVQEALYHKIDILWIGARSTVNPFTVQEIADSLKGVDIPVLIKNPINPDPSLWIGAVERVYQTGITKIGAIHRGFSTFNKTRFRNPPQWKIPIDLKKTFPDIPLLCDPSHIAGDRNMIFDISQKAADLDFDGLMIEVHPDPDKAWSDAKQQVTPKQFTDILSRIKFRDPTSENKEFISHLEELREKIDHLDQELYEVLSERMKLVDQIGYFKRDNNVTVFQKNRWKEISESRGAWAKSLGLNVEFMDELFKMIHQASIRRQEVIMNREESEEEVSDE
ncbi:chorismate mutase [Bacteroidota bacterium]